MLSYFLLSLCATAAVSQKDCGTDEITCTSPWGDSCLSTIGYNYGYDGKACPVFCATYCEDDELLCSSLDYNGCPEKDTCQPPSGKKGNDEKECPNFCPKNCGSGMKQCDAGHDWNGCKKEDVCIHEDMCNPAECPKADYDMYGCQFQPQCGDDSQLCVPYTTSADGCQTLGTCILKAGPEISPRTFEPCKNYCPMDCPDAGYQCAGDFDSQGCRGAPYCPTQTTDGYFECVKDMNDQRGCYVFEYPACDGGEQACKKGLDSNICPMGWFCQNETDPCPEPTLPFYWM